METAWEKELAQFLDDLLAVQDQTLDVLVRKRQMLASADIAGMEAMTPQEETLTQRLQEVLQRREELLGRAAQEGLPAKSLQAIAHVLPKAQRDALREPLQSASSRMRLLQHHSLTNWVLAQRTLLHLAQMLEIIATGGRFQPTYGNGERPAASGALVDRAA